MRMDKAVLVMDMPECCADCPCSFFERDNTKLNLICGMKGEDANNVGKPDWCPLIPMPEKRDYNFAMEEAIKEECFDTEDPQDYAFLAGKVSGWNACIDAIERSNTNE